MNRPASSRTIIPILIGLTLLACGLLLYFVLQPSPAPAPPPSPGINTQVYVWQRNWSPSVNTAVRTHGSSFHRIVVLSRQVSWEGDQPRTFRVAVNWQSLQASGAQVGAAVRIERPPGTLPTSRPTTTSATRSTTAPASAPTEAACAAVLAQALTDIRAEAAQNHVPLSEIQIDFDTSVARIPGYRQWLSAAKPAAGDLPIAITTVPACLDSPDFPALAKAAGHYILQVHGIEKPQTIADPLVIFDPAAARKAIAKAARIGVPFRVALPTYSYTVGFDAAGQYLGMYAENAPPDWTTGKTIRYAESRPAELAPLVKELLTAPPANFQGIIWYRLPVDTDKLNWKWDTLSAVMRGDTPAPPSSLP